MFYEKYIFNNNVNNNYKHKINDNKNENGDVHYYDYYDDSAYNLNHTEADLSKHWLHSIQVNYPNIIQKLYLATNLTNETPTAEQRKLQKSSSFLPTTTATTKQTKLSMIPVVINEMTIYRLDRKLAGTTFYCIVNNTNLAPPIRRSVRIDLNCK